MFTKSNKHNTTAFRGYHSSIVGSSTHTIMRREDSIKNSVESNFTSA
jgi:hypothetical protein